jgi:transporter family-2 protein
LAAALKGRRLFAPFFLPSVRMESAKPQIITTVRTPNANAAPRFWEDGGALLGIGIIFSIIAGMAMSIQGVMNTRLSERIGLFESNAFVQGTAFALSLIAVLVLGKGSFSDIFQGEKIYLFGGALGLVITITVMLGIKNLSPTISISIILISQLLVAALIDAFGLMGAEKVVFGWSKYLGIGMMIAGVLLFKLKQA